MMKLGVLGTEEKRTTMYQSKKRKSLVKNTRKKPKSKSRRK